MTHTADEFAEDVTELREAQRIIAQLRRTVAHLQVRRTVAHLEKSIKELEIKHLLAEQEFSAFLDDEHAKMLAILFHQKKLVEDQDENWAIEEAFSEFVSISIDLQWDTVRLEQQGWFGGITPSA